MTTEASTVVTSGCRLRNRLCNPLLLCVARGQSVQLFATHLLKARYLAGGPQVRAGPGGRTRNQLPGSRNVEESFDGAAREDSQNYEAARRAILCTNKATHVAKP